MYAKRQLFLSVLTFTLTVLSLPAVAQQVIATVPVGRAPDTEAINPSTNLIYVANLCGNDFSVPCSFPRSQGTVSVIDGSSSTIKTTIAVGYAPFGVAVNPLTNQIYVANQCGNDPTCASNGTLSVIDGASNSVIATVPVEGDPYAVAVNTVTNRIYVVNGCSTDPTCATFVGTVTVIDGASHTVITTVPVGASPENPVINQATNQIYVPNSCGTDPTCAYPYAGPGTVTVIDGATNNPSTVQVGVYPYGLDVNPVTNKIYVANNCGDDLQCNGLGSVTVIDGSNLTTTEVVAGGYGTYLVSVNSVTNKIYVLGYCFGDPSCGGFPEGVVSAIDGGSGLLTANVGVGVNPLSMGLNSVTNKVYVANYCGKGRCSKHYNGTVTVIDAANPNLPAANVNVGTHPYAVAVNSATNKIYIPNICGDDTSCVTRHGTVSVIDGTPPNALQFVSLSQPCRAVDTRPSHGGGGPVQGGTFQSFSISGTSPCGIPSAAAAYSMNVTVVPHGTLGYLTVWPAGQPQPLASTLNSIDGRVKADASIMPAGTGGQVSVYATNTTDVILDIAGYFAPPSLSTLAFYPLAPCRVADTRRSSFPDGLGPPSLTAGKERVFPILNASILCNIPTTAQAYSLNFTVVPQGSLGYLTVWPHGQPQPTVSTLNDVLGQVIANAAIVVGDSSGQISAYATSNTDLIIDINGYFGPASPTGLSLYGVSPCRVIDTRKIGSGMPFMGTLTPPVDVWGAGCSASSLAQAYVFNASVIPSSSLGYLTLWTDGQPQPVVSTLNSVDGSITSNMAIVPTALVPPSQGYIDAFVTDYTQLFLDLSSYFAP